MSYGLNRYLCDVLSEMRTCSESNNFSYLPSLVEEAQTLANRMESSLYDKRDYKAIKAMISEKKIELEKLEKELQYYPKHVKPLTKQWDRIQELRKIMGVN